MNKYNENITKEISDEFKDMCLKMQFDEDDINKYLEMLKNNLKQEYKKLTQENINLLRDKYNSELNKEIDIIFNDKEKISKINYISFINELIQIKYKLDSSIPDFFLKQQISFDKIIEAIKKYIEEFFVKNKNSIEQKINSLILKNNYLEEKNKKLIEEYSKDKNDFKNTVNKYNDMLIENKLKTKSLEEKIKNFEGERRKLKEMYELNSEEKYKELNDIINKLNLENNKLKIEIKTKEEEILLMNLNKEQDMALNIQKINFLENEINEWKSRYNLENKELSEIKAEKIHLMSNNDKLKIEVKNLKNKISNYEKNNENNDEKNNMNMTITGKGFYNSNGIGTRAGNKLLIELMTGQNYIKDFLDEIKNNTEKILDMNNNILNNMQQKKNKNKFEHDNIIHNNINNNSDINDNKDIHKQFFSNEKNNTDFDLLLSNSNNIIKKLNYSNKKENVMNINNKNEINDSIIKIKIINHILKKTNSGKPYIDYICEIKYKEKIKKLHRKFMNFYSFHKNLIEFFKDKINIPDKDNLFKEENIKNSLLENRQDLLNNYIEEISKINEIKKSLIFHNFFELNS